MRKLLKFRNAGVAPYGGLKFARLVIAIGIACSFSISVTAVGQSSSRDQQDAPMLAEAIRNVSPLVLSDEERKSASGMIGRDLRRRRDAANTKNRAEWRAITTRQQWEDFRDERLKKLRASLGTFPDRPARVPVRITGVTRGDGFRIENIVYESRSGDWVTANLYSPAKPLPSMPAILIAHAHHRPKRQGEMQDMGMTWARAGCVVLVIDQVGYGERRAHPFHGPDDYPEDYKYWRQDYYFRYDSGIQLQLAGESLMGWMVQDWMRGIELLLSRDGVDPRRIIMLGAVAGGGDPCGVTAALDTRIAAAVPFNFGGPQPETRYPLPDDAETSFNYLMGSYWESTRGLRRTAADGFFHWVIVGGIAPRRLIHGHEFAWDGKRDPVWKRFQKIYGDFYDVADHLAVAHGHGTLTGKNPRGSHCTNIGRVHRQMIHPVFERWFGIVVKPDDEYSARRDPDELLCMTEEVRQELKPRSFVELVSDQGRQRAIEARNQLLKLSAQQRRGRLRRWWSTLLGDIDVPREPRVVSTVTHEPGDEKRIVVERVVLEVEPDVVVPVLVLSDGNDRKQPSARAVVALSQSGKTDFLKNRSDQIAELVSGGSVICLPDLRGTGETRSGSSRGRTSGDGNRSVNLLMFDQTVLGQRLRDLRSVLAYLRSREGIDGTHVSLWAESFARVNPPDAEFKVPYDVAGRPHQSEPGGGLLALLGALFDERVDRVYVRGGLLSFQSVLTSPYVYIPHDAVVPGALTAGDLVDLVAALAPRHVCLQNPVDGLNRLVSRADARQTYQFASRQYREAQAGSRFVVGNGDFSPARWLLSGKTP